MYMRQRAADRVKLFGAFMGVAQSERRWRKMNARHVKEHEQSWPSFPAVSWVMTIDCFPSLVMASRPKCFGSFPGIRCCNDRREFMASLGGVAFYVGVQLVRTSRLSAFCDFIPIQIDRGRRYEVTLRLIVCFTPHPDLSAGYLSQ